MWEYAGIVITSLNIYYSDLPTTVTSYNNEEYSVKRFYDQKIPNIVLGGHRKINEVSWFNWNLNTGIHTKKLDTGNFGLGYNHIFQINDSSRLKLSVSNAYSITKHKPCSDSFDRLYYCGNLTAWSDLERPKNEKNIQNISLSYAYRW